MWSYADDSRYSPHRPKGSLAGTSTPYTVREQELMILVYRKAIFDHLPSMAESSGKHLEDELWQYLDSPTVFVKALPWWWTEQAKRYPNLSRIVLDYLSIPGTSLFVLLRIAHSVLYLLTPIQRRLLTLSRRSVEVDASSHMSAVAFRARQRVLCSVLVTGLPHQDQQCSFRHGNARR